MAGINRRISPLLVAVIFYTSISAIFILLYFPFATDPPATRTRQPSDAVAFYTQAYAPPVAQSEKERAREEEYVSVARQMAKALRVEETVRGFVDEYHLQGKRVLDVGSGRGYLQDLVADYVGLDISPSAGRFYHKPFVVASATEMPFKDRQFDAIWTVWVLEHIPNPESALREMRRVVRPGGVILLMPAWFCPSWAAQGYGVRPYSDLGLGGKAIKAGLWIRSSPLFLFASTIPIRALRYSAAKVSGRPTSFHYSRLTPNYETYWVPDSDAVNSMDPFEAALWFESRGDKCLNCRSGFRKMVDSPQYIVIRVGEPAGS
jgi:SAM-dependent methyltransferase